MGSPFVVLNVGDMHPCAHSDSHSLTLSCLAILSRTLLCVCFITCSGVYVCVCSLFFSCGYVCSCTPFFFFVLSLSHTLSHPHTHTLSLSLSAVSAHTTEGVSNTESFRTVINIDRFWARVETVSTIHVRNGMDTHT